MRPLALYPALLVSGFVMDVVWTKYIAEVNRKRPVRAGLWAVGTLLIGGVNVLAYTTNPWNLLPLACGCFLGTWWVVRGERGEQ